MSAHATSSKQALVATLLVRAGLNGALAVWLFARAPGWLDIFAAGAVYALADGALGLLAAGLLVRREPIGAPSALVSIVAADSILRCGAGVAVLALPGISDFPITLVLFYGALGMWAAVAGVIALIAWFVGHGHEKVTGQSGWRTHAVFDPLAAAGLIALMLAGYALIAGPPATAESLRIAAGTASGALAIVFILAAFGAAGGRLLPVRDAAVTGRR